MGLLTKLKRLTVRRLCGRPVHPSQILTPNPAQSADDSAGSKKRIRPAKISIVTDMIIKPKRKPSPMKTLRSLPTELLIQIATLLAPIDRASLAFTSSWLHGIFGNATKLNQYDRWQLLIRFEGDNIWPSEILCEICQKFHVPRKSRQRFTEKEGRRTCIRNGALYLQQYSISPYLSREIHFDVMAAISRSHHFTPTAPLPGEPSVEFVARYDHPENELAIRLQQSIHFSKTQEFDLPGEELHECVWTHKGDCWVNCQARSRLDSVLEGRIWSCGACSTDYAVNIIRSERSCANYIVMTSWKDVGSCIRRDDPRWKEHMEFGIYAGHKREEFGTIAGQIDKLTKGLGNEVYFFPRISKKKLREIFVVEGGCEEKMIIRSMEVDS
ncbi:hypothetical protein FGADI_5767 [Fusarium gaditjirri]|uniref:F-box domain-containing protein n=1 Tax=Fusarium gaditjirri TaxID=282569 RepID=A0A8H4T9L8_9HYPO|nr:hypothetical protein FGADI_5767 [Fusarium gaditjirri]